VYNAQAQYGKALDAYERAASLASGPERVRYQGLRAKMEERTQDCFYVNGTKYDPGRNGNDAMFARFEEAVPDRSKFGMHDQNLTPLGYMTAAHKLYAGYPPIPRSGQYDTGGFNGIRQCKMSLPKDSLGQLISLAMLFSS